MGRRRRGESKAKQTGPGSVDRSPARTFDRGLLPVALVVAGLGLRIWAASLNVFPTVDGVFYLEQAGALVREARLPWSCFPPGWPALISLPALFLDRQDPLVLLRAAQTMNVILGVLAAWLAYLMMRPRLGRGLALAGLAVLLFLPLQIVYSKNDLSEMSFTCVLLGAWLLVERRRQVGAGLLLGFAYLIRPEALLAAGGLVLWRWIGERRPPWRLIAPLVAVMLPYLLYIRLQTGAFDVTSKTVAVSLSLEAYPGWSYLGLIGRNLGILLPKLAGILGLPLILAAVWGAIRDRGAWLWLLAPLLPVPFIINPMDERFWVPYLPLLLLAAGLGARDLTARLKDRTGRPRWTQAAVLVLLLSGLVFAARDDVYWIRRNGEAYYGLQAAGEWLRDRTDSETVVAAYKPYASYWAGCRFIKYPDDMDAAQLVTWARNSGAKYMVVNVKVTHHLLPALDPLLEAKLRPDLARRITLVELIQYDRIEQNTAIYLIRDSRSGR